MSDENTDSEEIKRLKAELAFSEEMRQNEALANQERIKAVIESSVSKTSMLLMRKSND